MTEYLVADQHPVLERVTTRVGVLACDRPVVSSNTAIVSAMRSVVESGRGVQLLTPSTSRLTTVLRATLTELCGNWIVKDPNGDLYEGLLGVQVHWDGAAFVVTGAGEPAPAFLRRQDGLGRQLTVVLRVRHAATPGTTVGGAVALLAKALTGTAPAGWGTAEPVTQPWHEVELTAFVRKHAPYSTRLTFRGSGDRPFAGTVEIGRVSAGVEENIIASAGLTAEPAADLLVDLARTAAQRYALVSMLAAVAPGRRDLTYGPHATDGGAPLALTVGAELTKALPPGDGISTTALGTPEPRGVHYYLEGTETERWQRLARLVSHLGIPVHDGAP